MTASHSSRCGLRELARHRLGFRFRFGNGLARYDIRIAARQGFHGGLLQDVFHHLILEHRHLNLLQLFGIAVIVVDDLLGLGVLLGECLHAFPHLF